MDKSESEILAEWDLLSSDIEQEEGRKGNQNPDAKSVTNPQSDNENKTNANVGTSQTISEAAIDVEAAKEAKAEVTDSSGTEKIAEMDSREKIEVEVVSDTEEGAEADTEEASEPDTEEITVIETIMYDVKRIADVDANTNIQTENAETKAKGVEYITECPDAGVNNADSSANIGGQTSDNDDHVSPDLTSSMEHIQMEGSHVQDLSTTVPNLPEQENASIESSSSDIDIIDEAMEESVSSSFVHPLSLSISSSVDSSSILTSPSEGGRDIKTEASNQTPVPSDPRPKLTDVYPKAPAETSVAKSESLSKREPVVEKSQSVPRSEPECQRHSFEERRESYRRQRESQRPQPDPYRSIVNAVLQFLRNMSWFEWSVLGGVVIGVYFTVVFNQTNIFAVVDKNDVVSQMKTMMDELKNDNKLLKDQMVSEMKNEKVFSSFEHQIKELRKENSRLNHMLYDVAKVLEKQKDSHDKHEKKEPEYLAPFKKEINQLKEHINILKFDNEELQKQLVRMRYSSYSQGHQRASDTKEKDQSKSEETASSDEIPLDMDSLKKWNELISLLSRELGLLPKEDPLFNKGSHSENKKNLVWYWKAYLNDFKGTLEELRANITSKFSDYVKLQEKGASVIHKFIKNFFMVDEQQNNQQFVPPDMESSQWKNFGDFFSDLKDKWTKIRNRIDTSDLKSYFKDLKMNFESDAPQEYTSQKPKSSSHEYDESKTSGVHFESERKYTNAHFESGKEHDGKDHESEESQWMFERAALRAELRDTEKEKEENWFLKKNKQPKEESKHNRY